MKINIKIQNLKCGGCAATIVNNLKTIANVQDVVVDLDNKQIQLTYLNEEAVLAVKQKLEKIGYPEEGSDNSVVMKAKSYVSCAIGKMNT